MYASRSDTPTSSRAKRHIPRSSNTFYLSLRNGNAVATITTAGHGYGEIHFDKHGRFKDMWVRGEEFCVAHGKIKLLGIDRQARVRLKIIENGRVCFRGRITFNVRFDVPSHPFH